MADFVHINTSISNGREVLTAVKQIRTGLAKLAELEGLKNEAIAKSQGDMQSIFGTNTTTEAQILADRWGALIAAYDDMSNAEYAKLRDLLNATLEA